MMYYFILTPLFLFAVLCLPQLRLALRPSQHCLQPCSTTFNPRNGGWSINTILSTMKESATSTLTITSTSTSTSSTGQSPNISPNNRSSSDPKEPVMPYELTTLADQLWDTACDAFVHLKRMFIVKKHGIVDPNQFSIPTNCSSPSYKPRILVVGSGWSAHAFIKIIETDKFDVLCISPRPYFVFTPMLPHAVVGNVEYRSIVEPIRAANPLVEYLEGEVVDIFPDENRCKVTSDLLLPNCSAPLDVYYDHIVFAVGAKTGTFGVQGANEYCCFIKEVDDVKKLKSKIVRSFEAASLPGVSVEEVHRYLTFCIIGGGPTGSEYCAVLIDFLKSEIPPLYPRLVDKVKIILLSSSEDILPTFDKSLRKKAMDNFKAFNVDFRLKSRVVRVDEKSVTYTIKDSENPNVEISQAFGTCVWAAGVAPRAITTQLAERLGEPQISNVKKGGRLIVDKWLRVGGSNRVLSMGDCAQGDEGNESKSLPQTAQVAAQQGAYIARLFNRGFLYPFQEKNSPPRVNPVEFGGVKNVYLTSAVAKPFNFLNLGILAYIGDDKALAEIQIGRKNVLKAGGRGASALWKSVYVAKQVSTRTRFLVFFDFVKTAIFGRDLSDL